MARRKRREIQYRLRKVGRYFYICWTDGGPKRISTRQTDLTSAESFKANYLAALSAPKEQRETTVSMVLTEYRAAKEAPGQAYATIKNALAHIERFFGPVLIDNITPQLCRKYIAERKELKRADDTIRRELGAFRAAINYCIKEGWKIPSPPIPLPSNSQPKDIWLTRAQIKQLIDSATEDHIKLFIMLAYTTCARKQAILELTWDRVNMNTKLIDFRTPEEKETNKRRGVKPINKLLYPMLEQALELAQSDYVIEWCGKPVGNIRRSFMTAAKEAGLPKEVTPHTLKHSAGVHMAMDGVPIWEICQRLDHTSVRTTEKHYLKYSPDFMKKSTRALERL